MTADHVGRGQGSDDAPLIMWLSEITSGDTAIAGHKSVNLARVRALAELPAMAETATKADSPSRGIAVPDGFVVTSRASAELLKSSGLGRQLDRLGAHHLRGEIDLREYSESARGLLGEASVPLRVRSTISKAYDRLSLTSGEEQFVVAVRSSAAMEDSVGRSFAGQFDSVLEVGTLDEVIEAYLKVIASSLGMRALSYRQAISGHLDRSVSEMSVLVQRMVRSDRGSAGVLMTSVADPVETSSAEPVTLIEVVRGTAEAVVGGSVNPESHVVRLADRNVTRAPGAQTAESILDDATALVLAEWGGRLEVEFGSPVQLEWARDGVIGELAVVQVRPIPHPAERFEHEHSLPVELKPGMKVLARGLAIGDGVVSGPAVVVEDPHELFEGEVVDRLPEEFVLVVATTSPEWVPLMRLASALVTDHGGRGSHAAIVCRELALPAVLGCGDATTVLLSDQPPLDLDRSVPPKLGAFRPVVVACDERTGGEVWG